MTERAAESADLPDSDVQCLARFIFASQGRPGATTADAAAEGLALDLLGRLKYDLNYECVKWSLLDDDGYSMSELLSMVRRSDNRFFSLELWWSID